LWRKRNKFFSFLLLFAVLLSGCSAKSKPEEEHTTDVFAMGTYMALTAYGESAEAALTLSEDRIKELEALWSTTDENSDIYKVNQSGGVRTEVREETAEILQFTLDMAEQTNSSLDPTISPVVTAWGFISGEYHIPTEDEWTDLL
jgi:thiamine biosynthesis lipoprotein